MKPVNQLLFLFLALAAGMMIPFQSAMNAQLGKTLASPYYASLTVFAVAFFGLLIFILSSRMAIPSARQFGEVPFWSFAGGLLGGVYILLIVVTAPKLGIGNVTVLVLLGQVISAVLIDQFGLLRSPVHPINWQRLAGVTLVVLGVYLVKKF